MEIKKNQVMVVFSTLGMASKRFPFSGAEIDNLEEVKKKVGDKYSFVRQEKREDRLCRIFYENVFEKQGGDITAQEVKDLHSLFNGDEYFVAIGCYPELQKELC